MDGLRIELRRIIAEDRKANNYESWRNRNIAASFHILEMTALHIAQKTSQFLNNFRNHSSKVGAGSVNIEEAVTGSHLANNIVQKEVPDVVNLSLESSGTTLMAILDKTTEQICADIPTHFRILHLENIVRDDLCSRFRKAQEHIRQKLLRISKAELLYQVPHKERAHITRMRWNILSLHV